MNIEIWSDIACPFCYIGKRHLELALEQTGMQDEVTINWRSFQLDPTAAKETDRPMVELLAEKYGRDIEWARAMNKNMSEMAAKVGLEYDMDGIQATNTLDAHRLIHLAKQEGKQGAMKEAILKAYFMEAKNVGKVEELVEIGESLGLDGNRVQTMLDSKEFTDGVQADVQQAQAFGISGVPFFVINNKYGVSGAQPVEQFVEMLKQVKAEQGEENTSEA